MYNIGFQNYKAAGVDGSFWACFFYGLAVTLPKIAVSYIVGLGIEFIVAQWKKEEIQEGFLVSGILIPMIVPVGTPLWMLAVAVAFSVIFAKEIYGGTGMNIFNPALVTRAFLFFAWPTKMSGDAVWVSTRTSVGIGTKSARRLHGSHCPRPSRCQPPRYHFGLRNVYRFDARFHW